MHLGKVGRVIIPAMIGITVVCAGCSFNVALKYDPVVRGAEDPVVTVDLKVIDDRTPDFGGTNKTEIGRVRGGYGNPFPVYESDSQQVAHLVRDATADALRLARVGVAPDAQRVLVATVKEFWIDGYIGYKASVIVQCVLQDRDGGKLWTASISGAGGGAPWWTATSFIAPTFQKALAEYAENAAGQFGSQEFQKNVF
jgi:hypothetical protein